MIANCNTHLLLGSAVVMVVPPGDDHVSSGAMSTAPPDEFVAVETHRNVCLVDWAEAKNGYTNNGSNSATNIIRFSSNNAYH